MPVPKFNLSNNHKTAITSDIERKAEKIMSFLIYDMDRDVANEREAVRLIEYMGVEKFNFDYPYGSFEAFKRHVLAGEFDKDFSDIQMTDEDRKMIAKAEREGKMWHTD